MRRRTTTAGGWGAPLLALAVLLGACEGPAATVVPATPGSSSTPTAAPTEPTPTATPTAEQSASPTPTPAPTPTPTPSPRPTPIATPTPTTPATPSPMPTRAPVALVLRVDSADETDVVPYPDISYYSDGIVITPGSVGRLETRQLSPAGLATVLHRVAASGLLDRDGRRFTALLPNRGLLSLMVAAHLPGADPAAVHAFVNADATGETAKFLDLAAALADPASWLPKEAWLRASPELYESDFVRVQTTIEDVSDPATWNPDISSVDWPLAVPFDGVGDVLSERDGYLVRCAVLPVEEADAIRAALLAAGAKRDLDWTGSLPLQYGTDRAIGYAFMPQLPDGEPACQPDSADAGWSVSGEIAYVRRASNPAVRLWGVADGSEPVVTRGQEMAWSPDGTRLAVIRPRSDDLPDLWVVDVATGDEKRIVRPAVSATWSPTGDLLAVSRSPVDVGDLWLVRPGGGGLRELPNGGGQVAWSPDGGRLAVVTGTGSPMLGVLDVKTGRRIDLVAGTDPAWTGEDSPRIAYAEWGTGGLAVVDPVTGASTTLPGPDEIGHLVRVEAPGSPGWALAFIADGAAWILDDLEAAPRRLTAPGEVVGELSAVPGGEWLATVVRTDAGTDLVVVAADGDGWFQLTEVGNVIESAARPEP